jgi:hypothetical protein
VLSSNTLLCSKEADAAQAPPIQDSAKGAREALERLRRVMLSLAGNRDGTLNIKKLEWYIGSKVNDLQKGLIFVDGDVSPNPRFFRRSNLSSL